MTLKEMLGGKRGSLVLLHPTSLPDPEGRVYGVGELGSEAVRFIDFLSSSGTLAWQVLPLGHTGYMDSPYQTFSRVAGSPYVISIEKLLEAGDLTREQHDAYVERVRQSGLAENRTHYGWLFHHKMGGSWDDASAVLRLAFSNFERRPADDQRRGEFASFLDGHRQWLDDYAEYMAIKEHHGQRAWSEWEPEFRHAAAWRANRGELTARMPGLERTIAFYQYLQFVFFEQWQAVHSYARRKGRMLIGDIPWYVGYDSANVWARPEIFELNPDGTPTCVAGVPPDYFSKTGQLWGNPVYDWSKQAALDWWVDTTDILLDMVDAIRIDHFRAVNTYWKIPYDWAVRERTAKEGCWGRGPERALLAAIRDRLLSKGRLAQGAPLPIIAEDLGFLDPLYARVEDYPHDWSNANRFRVEPAFSKLMLEGDPSLGPAFDPQTRQYSTRRGVDALLEEFKLPWMGVLQFGFQGAERHLPVGLTPNSVIYTGTHDNDTSLGWYFDLAKKEDEGTTDPLGGQVWRAFIRVRDMRQLEVEAGENERHLSWEMIEIAWSAQSDLSGAPMQDLLELGSEARMNLPGDTKGGWWAWRATRPQMDYCRLQHRLLKLNEVYERFA